jgi:hypothetical protein
MSTPAGKQIDNNAENRQRWECFAAHRERVTRHLLRGSAGGRLCVLGAGNCNDLDLPALAEHFGEVRLVDLDGDALAFGVDRQGVRGHGGVQRHVVELTGWLGEPAGPDQWRHAPRRRVAPLLPGPFDVVASVCVLSQLSLATLEVLGVDHPMAAEAVRAVREGHLDLLAHLVAPGGQGLLITDIVSSDTVPGLASLPEERLASLPELLVRQRNYFHGVQPFLVAASLRALPAVNDLETLSPWLWDLGPRVYLVCGFGFRHA